MENVLLQIWKDAETPLDYITATWISGLFGLAIFGFVSLLYGMVTGQVDFSNATFGIFDTLGS